MAGDIDQQLNKALSDAHALEKQAKRMLEAAKLVTKDSEVAAIFSAHLIQTEEHARYISERLEARGKSPSKLKDAAAQASAFGLGGLVAAAPNTPIRLASVAFAFENLEVAHYRILRRLAERAGDRDTLAVAERILEQEEAAAELVAGTFDRALENALGEEPSSPLPAVAPIGKPSERQVDPKEGHPGPQQAHETEPDQPIAQPPHVETPAEGEHLASPEPGHPGAETQPVGGGVPDPEHPERIGATTPGKDTTP
jgi:ferritin-like metal-binding protein YciE